MLPVIPLIFLMLVPSDRDNFQPEEIDGGSPTALYEVYVESPPVSFGSIIAKIAEEITTKNVGACKPSPEAQATAPCLISEDGFETFWLPPFPSLLPEDLNGEKVSDYPGLLIDGIGSDDLGWAPPERVSGGEGLLATWRKMALDRTLFGCQDDQCLIIVHSFRGEWPDAKEEILSVCMILTAAGTLGVPEACTPLAVTHENVEWIRIKYKVTMGAGPVPAPLQVRFVSGKSLQSERVYQLIEQALSSEPLKLQTKMRGGSIQGFSGRRSSPVISDWREDLTVYLGIDIRSFPGTTIPEHYTVAVDGWFFAYVNRHNTERRNDWWRPSDEQEDAYLGVLEKAIEKSLAQLCSSEYRYDSLTTVCDFPQEFISRVRFFEY